jgi:hypothetical protein
MEMVSDQSRRDTLRDQLVRLLHKILPFERPRLAAMTVKSDAENSLRVQADLTVLTDAGSSASRRELGLAQTSPHDNNPNHDGRQLAADLGSTGCVIT